MKGRIGAAVAAFILTSLCLSFSALPCAAQASEPIGSEWVYSLQEEYYGTVVSTGTWTLSCERITPSPIGNESVAAVEYHSVLIYESTSSSSSMGYQFLLVSSEDQYYDINTSDFIGSVSEEHLNESYLSGGQTVSHTLDERNVTVNTPPGGSGNVPASVSPGDTWTVTYTKVTNESGYEDGIYFEKEYEWTETERFTYVGTESVSVQTGTFSCDKYTVEYSNGWTETFWWSQDVSSYAKVVDTDGYYDVVTYELSSYSRGSGSGGGTVEMGSDLFIAGFFSFVAATAVAAAYASVIVKRRDLQPEMYEEYGGQA